MPKEHVVASGADAVTFEDDITADQELLAANSRLAVPRLQSDLGSRRALGDALDEYAALLRQLEDAGEITTNPRPPEFPGLIEASV